MRMNKDSWRTSTTISAKTTFPFDRQVQQAIVALKKGAPLLKYGRRGKPKFCPFRLSTEENHLLWYSGKKERRLSLDSVTQILVGQRTVNFQRQPQPGKEYQSFSLIYADGKRSLDLICKDKVQAETWCTGLRALISPSSNNSGPLRVLKTRTGVQSSVNSPSGYTRGNQHLIQPDLPFPSETPKWGHVACPAFFKTYNNDCSSTAIRNGLTIVSPTNKHIADLSTGSKGKKTSNIRLLSADEDGKRNNLATTAGEVTGDAIEHRVGRLEKEILSLQTSHDRVSKDVQDLVHTMKTHMDRF